jgi:hypothetical protein
MRRLELSWLLILRRGALSTTAAKIMQSTRVVWLFGHAQRKNTTSHKVKGIGWQG